jgi:YVTN family beta-propeller protein
MWGAALAQGNLERLLARLPGSARTVIVGIQVGLRPEGVAVGSGAVWVANHGSGTVSRIDPRSDRVVATITVGQGPARIVTGSNAIWVTDDRDRMLWRIDPRTNRASAIRLRGKVSGTPTIARGAIWATVWDDATLVRIDPNTNHATVAAHIEQQPTGVQFANGSFWITSSNRGMGKLSRIDATSYRTQATFRAGRLPWFQGASVSDGGIWVADAMAGLVFRFDAITGQPVGYSRVGDLPIVAVAGGSVWVNEANHTLARIDPATDQIIERVQVGGSLGGVAAGFGGVWLVGTNDGILWRLDALS